MNISNIQTLSKISQYIILIIFLFRPYIKLILNMFYKNNTKSVKNIFYNAINLKISKTIFGLISVTIFLSVLNLLKIYGILFAYSFFIFITKGAFFCISYLSQYIENKTIQNQKNQTIEKIYLLVSFAFSATVSLLFVYILHKSLTLNLSFSKNSYLLNILSIQDKSDINKFMFSFLITSYMIKFSGNLMTKLGDIISDYNSKILGEKEKQEDKSLDSFSIIDNVGDIYGDLYGNIIDYISLFFISIYCLTANKSSIIDNIWILLFYSITKIVILICFFVIFNFFSKNSIYRLIVNNFNTSIMFFIILFAFINTAIAKYLMYSTYKGFYSSMLLNSCFVVFFSIPTILLQILFFTNIYKNIAKAYIYVLTALSPLAILTFPAIFIIVKFIYYGSILTYSLYFKMFNINEILVNYQFFDYMFMSIILNITKVAFGVFVDSSCGLYKKSILENNINNTELVDYYEHKLEYYDNIGNTFKIESRLTLFIIIVVLLDILWSRPQKVAIVIDLISSIESFIFIFFISSCTYLYKKSKKIKENSLYNIVVFSQTFFLVFMYVISKYKGIIIGQIYHYLIIGLGYIIIGGILDIAKKMEELQEISATKELKLNLVKYDLIGDFFKDVIGPSAFSVAFILILNILQNIK
ncbi:hypothetical protein AB837_00064 [bacterium AB1]|nr:hypothetical protein AB837_00064 [bacterium AB1]